MAIHLPQKPRAGFHAINELTRAVNGLIDYISSFSITGEKPIRVHRSMFQTEISIDPAEFSGGGGGYQYRGHFKVEIEDGGTTCQVIDGGNDSSVYAGLAYYNIKAVWCQKATGITIETGFLCLTISENSSYQVSYGFENTIPDMPTLADSGDDNTVKYPLAYFSQDSNGDWTVQQLCYGLPQLWCFGPCDTEESGS